MTAVTITIEDLVTGSEAKKAKLVKFAGQLDESNVDEKAKLLYQVIEEGGENLVLIFEFSDLEYMNSKSIGYLTDWYGKLSAKNGKIVIAHARENIVDILQVVGLTQLITCYPTVEEAKLAVL